MSDNKAFIKYEGVEYYDYDLISIDGAFVDKTIYFNYDAIGDLKEKLKRTKNNQFKPSKGDEICVIPDCKYNLEDIRKNYKIKRGFDKGTCNVFSSIPSRLEYYGRFYKTAIIPSLKLVVIIGQSKLDGTLDSKVAELLNYNFGPNDVIKPVWVNYDGSRTFQHRLIATDIHGAYTKLLTGTLATPAIYIDNLDLNTGEDVTVDALEIVHRLCMEEVGYYNYDLKSDWDEKLKVQLAALNNLDWRKYPGTIDILMNGFILTSTHALSHMKNIVSRYPKNIKNILKHHSQKFASQEDQDLASAFLRRVLGIEGEQFTEYMSLNKLLYEHNVNTITFARCFDNMIRFRDKVWKDE